ncbi:MAG: dephospho-CoA kinase [Gammaproteobacteria bacterium]|jgi:dephospho-CoA kinase
MAHSIQDKFVIGLTGGIGSGKSTVAKLFAKLNVDIVDADEIAREIVQPPSELLDKIVVKFGEKILHDDGSLNRAKMREIIFNDLHAKKWLENLLHPIIYQHMYQQILATKSPYCIVIIPLLIESHIPYPIDRILVVDSIEEQQIKRIMQRDHTSEQAVKDIIKTQAASSERLKIADDVIENTKDEKYLQQQVEMLHKLYSRICYE